jgi:hypothetical protein
MAHDAIIDDVDETTGPAAESKPQIHFHRDGKSRSAPISGLKDRLSRAKKIVSKDSR